MGFVSVIIDQIINAVKCYIGIITVNAYEAFTFMYDFCIKTNSSVLPRIRRNIERGFVDYLKKPPATVERILADTRYAGSKRYASKAIATVERILADTRYAGSKRYASKAIATYKSSRSYRIYAIGYNYSNKANTIAERRISNARHAFGYHYVRKACTRHECTYLNMSYEVWYRYADQIVIIIKCIFPNNVTLSVIIIRKRKVTFVTVITDQVINAVNRCKPIISVIEYKAFSFMYGFCIITYVSVFLRASLYIK